MKTITIYTPVESIIINADSAELSKNEEIIFFLKDGKRVAGFIASSIVGFVINE